MRYRALQRLRSAAPRPSEADRLSGRKHRPDRRALLSGWPSVLVAGVFAAPGLAIAGPDVTHYQLDLTFDPATLDLRATAAVTVQAQRGGGALSQIDLELAGFTISQVTWNGLATPWSRANDVIDVHLPTPLAEGALGTIGVTYSGVPLPYTTDQGDLGVMQDDDITYAINVTDGAHYWFPSRDQLDDKASVDLALTLPEGYISAGPGHLEAVTDAANGLERHAWTMSQEVTPYLISFAFSDRYQRRRYDLPLKSGPLPADFVLTPGTWATAQANLDALPDMLDWLEARYGRFPYDQLGMHEIPFPGNVEQPGNVAMGSAYWTASGALLQYFAHELAHTWFQGVVTARSWDDIFLDESAAAWHELLYTEHAKGLQSGDTLAKTYLEAYVVGITQEGLFPLAEPEVLFGYTVYMKGPVVWRLLEHLMGREDLIDVLNVYLADADGIADLDDFFSRIEATGDPDLARFREEWIDRAGLPTYRFGWSTAPSADGYGVGLRIVQATAPIYRTPIDAELQFADGSSQTVTLRPGSGDHTEVLCVDRPVSAVLLDPRSMVPAYPQGSGVTVEAAVSEGCTGWTPTPEPDDDGSPSCGGAGSAALGGAAGAGAASDPLARGAAAIPLLTLLGVLRLRRRKAGADR